MQFLGYVTIVPIEHREDFTSFAKLPDIAIERYNQRSIDERQIDRVLVKGEMSLHH
jgi:hypothetical protein